MGTGTTPVTFEPVSDGLDHSILLDEVADFPVLGLADFDESVPRAAHALAVEGEDGVAGEPFPTVLGHRANHPGDVAVA